MNKQKLGKITFLIGVLLSSCAVGYAVIQLALQMPMTGTVVVPPKYETQVDGLSWSNGSSVSFGTLEPGKTYHKTFNIHNIGTSPFTATISIQALPSGWTLTYDKNGYAVEPTNWLNGTLSLTVSPDALGGSYSWNIWIYLTA